MSMLAIALAAALSRAEPSAAESLNTASPAAAKHDFSSATRNGRQAIVTTKDGDKIVCHTEYVTGSMFPKKTCRSEREIADRRAEERENIEKNQRIGDHQSVR